MTGTNDALYSNETSKLSEYSSADTNLFFAIEIGPLIMFVSFSEIILRS